MVEEKNNEVLKALISLCGETDSFKILDANDILAALPEKIKMTKEELTECIQGISDREMINIKYSTLDEYCVAILPKALIEEDSLMTSKGGFFGKKGKKLSARMVVFLSGLLGSFIGGILVTIISVVVIVALR